MNRRQIPRAPSRDLRIGAEVNATTKERPGCDDDSASAEATAVARLDSRDSRAPFIGEQICDHALRELELRELLEQVADGAAIERAIALSARSPHSGALRAIQHAELDRGAIGGTAHQAAQGIDFADDGTLSNAADGRVAGHLADRVQDGCEAKRLGTQPRCHCGCLSPGVATTNDDNVVTHGSKYTEPRVETSRETPRGRDAEWL